MGTIEGGRGQGPPLRRAEKQIPRCARDDKMRVGMTEREDVGGTAETKFKERLGTGLSARVFARHLRAEAPGEQVAGVESDAEKISGDETELRGADADDADDGAIGGGHDPALPQFFANEYGGEDGQNTRQIIKPDGVQGI